jgi:DNA-binding transcriptional ArsR family regulator
MDSAAAIAALAALAQETRLAIFRMLVARGPAGMPAGSIAATLGIPPSSLSFHLGQLSQAGLLSQRRVHRSLIYSANFEAMTALMGFLTANCCGGDPSACGVPAACVPASATFETID